MDNSVNVVLAGLALLYWLWLTFLCRRRRYSTETKLDRSELWVIVGAIFSGGTLLFAALTWFSSHPISIPIPQGNVTTASRYITIVVPRITPLLSPLEAWTLAIIAAIVFVGFGAVFIVGRAYGFYQMTHPKKSPPELGQIPPENEVIEIWEKGAYQDRVKRDIPQIEAELRKGDRNIDIQFYSWSRGINHSRKPLLIDNPKVYDALQDLSDALNNRNFYRFTKGFTDQNQICLEKIAKLRELHFIY